jgi:hypothetical protein
MVLGPTAAAKALFARSGESLQSTGSFGLITAAPVCQISLRRPAAYWCSKLAIRVW